MDLVGNWKTEEDRNGMSVPRFAKDNSPGNHAAKKGNNGSRNGHDRSRNGNDVTGKEQKKKKKRNLPPRHQDTKRRNSKTWMWIVLFEIRVVETPIIL